MRILHFVRHGAYQPTPTGGTLTVEGRRQARAIANRLKGTELAAIHCSTMSRAIETAAIIAPFFPALRLRKTDLLREAAPGYFGGIITRAKHREGRQQIDDAYARFFRPSRRRRQELFVAHGNLIRAFVCHAMKMPRSAWRRMSIEHCSLTTIGIDAGGQARLGAYNQHGHVRGGR